MYLSQLLAIPLAAQLVAAVPRYNDLVSRQNNNPGPRPQKGNIPYGGAGVRTCTVPGTVALTFDDGPNVYTGELLDQLASYGVKATFFVCGSNGRGALDGDSRWINLVKRMETEGHQVASHTWDHENLSEITSPSAIVDTMVKTEKAIGNILGKYPTYMRPPYATCTGICPNVMSAKSLGYVVSYYDLETDDWKDDVEQSKINFKNVMDSTPKSAGRVVLAHDTHQGTVTSLAPFMLQYLKDNGWKGVTLGECLGEAKENWYRAIGDNNTPSPTSSTGPGPTPSGTKPISAKGLCGTSGETCTGSVWGACCSQWGFCGDTDDYCKGGCQAAFGICKS